jgi:hypothetical protein
MTPEDRSKIDELKKTLYSRNAPEVRQKRRLHFTQNAPVDVPTDWEHPAEALAEEATLNKKYKSSSGSFFNKFFIASLIFFVLAMGIGAFLIYSGDNIISANNIDLIVNGPITVAGGDPLTFDVQVANKNNVTLQSVDLTVDFPAGTVDAGDTSKEYKQYHELLDDIAPGGVAQKRVSAILFGEENTKKLITLNISYRVAGSNAVFQKQKTYEVLISSSPLSLSIDSFKEVTAGQDFTFNITLTSNSSDVIKNLLLRAVYPFGFTLTSTDVKAEGNQSVWKIGDIPSKGKKVITFHGQLDGQDGEARTFRFSVGTQSLKTPGTIATEYIATTQEVSIQKPFISTAITFDSDSSTGEYIGTFDTPVRATISWFNNLPSPVIDGELHVKLSGNAFDKISVTPGEGYYKSADNEIVWNKITTASLTNIGPGGSGSVNFTFVPRNFSTPTKTVSSPGVSLDVNVLGKRISESNVPESITSSANRSIKISSQLNLASNVMRSSGPFGNTGPIPPQAEKQTTYTVVWTVDNTVNTVTGAEVRALLPPYVKWLGKVDPSGEDLTYNSNTGQIVWRVGNVDAFTVSTNHRRMVSFQVALEPSVAQVGQVPVLVQDTSLTGTDDFTGATLTATKDALTTNFTTDPMFHNGDGVVAK